MKVGAVTGTNGKSTTVMYSCQMLEEAGGNVWTITNDGVKDPSGWEEDIFWCREEGGIKKLVQDLSPAPDDILLIEAFSIAMATGLWEGMLLDAAAFTSFGRDHLDFHESEMDYFNAKYSLFRNCLKKDGSMIINRSVPHQEHFISLAKQKQFELLSYEDIHQSGDGPPFVFWDNVICASHLVHALIGQKPDKVCLKTLPGRVQYVDNPLELLILVDYAHNPAALEYVLKYIRNQCKGNITTVFGCGGNRDQGKRIEMGKTAKKYSDTVIITNDNPRDEQPDRIRSSILQGCPEAIEIPARRKALETALALSERGDGILVAGMGADSWPQVSENGKSITDYSQLIELIHDQP